MLGPSGGLMCHLGPLFTYFLSGWSICCSVLGLVWLAKVSPCHPFRIVSLLNVFIDTRHVGFQRCFGDPSQVEVFKLRVLDVGSEPFIPQGEAGSSVSQYAGLGFIERLFQPLPTHFSVGFFPFTWCIGVVWLDSRFFQRNYSICSCRFAMSVGEGTNFHLESESIFIHNFCGWVV